MILSSSQFLQLPQLPQKMTLVIKVVKFDQKIIISLFQSKLTKETVSSCMINVLKSQHMRVCLLSDKINKIRGNKSSEVGEHSIAKSIEILYQIKEEIYHSKI